MCAARFKHMNDLIEFSSVPCVLTVKQVHVCFWTGDQVLSTGKLRTWMVYGDKTVLISGIT